MLYIKNHKYNKLSYTIYVKGTPEVHEFTCKHRHNGDLLKGNNLLNFYYFVIIIFNIFFNLPCYLYNTLYLLLFIEWFIYLYIIFIYTYIF